MRTLGKILRALQPAPKAVFSKYFVINQSSLQAATKHDLELPPSPLGCDPLDLLGVPKQGGPSLFLLSPPQTLIPSPPLQKVNLWVAWNTQ